MKDSVEQRKVFVTALAAAISKSVESFNSELYETIKIGQKISQFMYLVGDTHYSINHHMTKNCQNKFLTTTINIYHKVEVNSQCILKFTPTEEEDIFEVSAGWSTWIIEGPIDEVIELGLTSAEIKL